MLYIESPKVHLLKLLFMFVLYKLFKCINNFCHIVAYHYYQWKEVATAPCCLLIWLSVGGLMMLTGPFTPFQHLYIAFSL